ncbi:glycosyltransferase family 4 protein [Allohahella marinimesophila]|uniref:Glycosyltransferase family 4 protein n=1 Tax=Allohahella marinimesophila TaxID=1054972 RepID=A0ABP7PN19_9GAMM
MRAMKVVMVSNEFPPSVGGVQTHVHELAKAMVRGGNRVVVVTRQSDGALPDSEIMDGIDVRRYPLPNSHLFYDFKLRRILKKLISTEGFEVVHIHGMRPLSAAKGLGVPVVFTNHTSSFLKRATQGPKVLEKMRRQLVIADMVLAPSDELVQATLATGYDKPPRFISNGADTNRFYPRSSDLRSRLNIPVDAFVVVLARRLVEKNGVLYFAKAIADLDLPKLHVLVAGDGAERAEFERIIKAAGRSENVHMLGAVANTDMPGVFSAGDVGILPSLMEATSIAGLEAMACGLPLIGTRVGGIPVIIDDRRSGILVEPRSPEALAEAISELYHDRDLAAAMGKTSLELARQKFSWDVIAAETVACYRSAR